MHGKHNKCIECSPKMHMYVVSHKYRSMVQWNLVITSSDITKAFYNKVILLVQDFCILLLLFFLTDYNKFIVIVPMSSL